MHSPQLSAILENLQQAYHLVVDSLHVMGDSGSFALLTSEVVAVRDKLNALTEIAAALLDAQREERFYKVGRDDQTGCLCPDEPTSNCQL